MALKEYLFTNKITHAAFAEKVGCTRQYITAICSKKRIPGFKLLARIVGEGKGQMSMGELCKEFRPDIWNAVMEAQYANGRGAMLTDEQCNEFRRLPLSFNEMVRAIYTAGFTYGKQFSEKEIEILHQIENDLLLQIRGQGGG